MRLRPAVLTPTLRPSCLLPSLLRYPLTARHRVARPLFSSKLPGSPSEEAGSSVFSLILSPENGFVDMDGLDPEEWEWVLDDIDDEEENEEENDIDGLTLDVALEAAAAGEHFDFALTQDGVVARTGLQPPLPEDADDSGINSEDDNAITVDPAPAAAAAATRVVSEEGAARLLTRLAQGEPLLDALRKKVAYFWLKDELGVGETMLEQIILRHGGLLSLDVEKNLEPKAVFFETLGLPRWALGVMVERNPSFMWLSLDANIKPTLAWLHWHVGLSHSEICGALLKAPALLGLRVSSNLAPKLDFLQDEVGLTPAQVRRMVATAPTVLGLSLEHNLRPKVGFLRGPSGLTRETVARVVAAQPRLLGASLDRTLAPRLQFLRRDLGLGAGPLNRVLHRSPMLLGFGTATRLVPTMALLRAELQCSLAQCRLLVIRSPRIFCNSPETLRVRIALLRDRLELTQPAEAIRLVVGCPNALSLRLDVRLDELLALLCGGSGCGDSSSDDGGGGGGGDGNNAGNRGGSASGSSIGVSSSGERLGMSLAEARKVLLGLPGLLGCSVESNLGPKVAALVAAASGDAAAVRAMVLASPALLGYSLAGRIEPRLRDLAAIGQPVAMLPRIVCKPTAEYKRWLAKRGAAAGAAAAEAAAAVAADARDSSVSGKARAVAARRLKAAKGSLVDDVVGSRRPRRRGASAAD
ncbi:unnamed protein product [Phaeothamnion confervicola]